MENRLLTKHVYELALNQKKMGFISGPRQSGKTTLSQQIGKFYPNKKFFSWDDRQFRLLWKKDPIDAVGLFDSNKENLVVLDEIHKNKLWKDDLKGLFDLRRDEFSLLVTGSARLDVFRKSGDSLLGRYFHFRLYPFSFFELLNKGNVDDFDLESIASRIENSPSRKVHQELCQSLIDFGPFPEPFLKQSKQFSNLWQNQYIGQLIKVDLRDLSGALEVTQVETLAELLPTKVMSPLSVQSLHEDLGPAHSTITRWLKYLHLVYFFFELKPYSQSIPRSLKKERKIYFYDWRLLSKNEPALFENFIAFHLLKTCHFLKDIGYGNHELFYLRNKEKKEVDFLVTKEKTPLFTVEVKLNDTSLDRTFEKFQQHLKTPHFQVIQKSGVFKKFPEYENPVFIVSADRFLQFCF